MRITFKFLLSIAVASIYVNFSHTTIYAQNSSKKTATSAKPTATELEEGKTLLSKSDCLACHKLDVKLVGPSYKDVAKKHTATEANYNLLTQKIIKGGSGVWGPIPMTPHATLKPEEAKKMVKYILSIK